MLRRTSAAFARDLIRRNGDSPNLNRNLCLSGPSGGSWRPFHDKLVVRGNSAVIAVP